jgi:hypothetical protein
LHRRIAIALLILPVAIPAQKLPDPEKVAPAYREAAEKRRADLIRRAACTDKAEKDKVVKRDLASYVNNCMDAAEKAQQVDTEPKMKQ